MASLLARTPCIHHSLHPISLHSITSTLSLPSPILFFPFSINHTRPSSAHHHPSFCGPPLNLSRTIPRSYAGDPGPPPGNEPSPSTGVLATISRLRDTLQIFFAVFFWMSLFFWASATGGNKKNRRNKGNRFRK